ncbi:MAG: hypothetical protein US52_C0011G0007 [candidate division WS6 bacterium GW2011_GWA2_37_6]|uniref:Trp repressor n=1 Tax=candidate division WS6 bacterium GW2011_GWA2_37_6 TaxID=1619087 RepID=A0A0G0GYH7_9BACT|nr:MAG: hypothetical protein US52_C0011G0007 [candidate division WS6 bacterium GW2011_GWA2_37_6]
MDKNSQKYVDELISVLSNIASKKEMSEFLEGLLTPRELLEIPTRLQIVKMLRQGVPQREIAEKLGVGIATVSRGSAELKRGKFQKITR